MADELGTQLYDVQQFRLNGIRAASGSGVITQAGRSREAFVVVYEGDGDQLFRFVMTGPRNGRSYDQRGWIDTLDSFRRLDDHEVSHLQPLTIDIVRVRRGRRIADLANRMAFDDYQEERFRTLNGLRNRDTLRRGQLVKIVVDGSH